MAKNKEKKKINFAPVEQVAEQKTLTIDEIIANLENETKKLNEKAFNFLFFVMDTKGAPNGELSYIYDTAYRLKEMGYAVKMLHADEEFTGVGDWMGEKYAKLPHYNIEKDGVRISPSDFLIIPELYSNVMFKTAKLPCKRIALMLSRGLLTEVLPAGITWPEYHITDCITDSNKNKKIIEDLFPSVKTEIVSPCVEDFYLKDEVPKKLYINVISRNPSDTNMIVKEFFLRYPVYKWIGFRDIRGVSRETLSEVLNEGFATIWIDEHTDFGNTALAAMAAGSIVIGKMPENEPDWMMKDGKLRDNGIWFYRNDEVFDIIATVISSFLRSNIPLKLYKEMEDTVSEYTENRKNEEIQKVYIDHFVENRKNEIKIALKLAHNKKEEENNK